jgi:hypothetical protein
VRLVAEQHMAFLCIPACLSADPCLRTGSVGEAEGDSCCSLRMTFVTAISRHASQGGLLRWSMLPAAQAEQRFVHSTGEQRPKCFKALTFVVGYPLLISALSLAGIA